MVSTTFLVQNNYYSSQTQRSGVQDNARVATELVASEVRNAMDSSLIIAGARTLTVRSPMALMVICNVVGAASVDVFSADGEAAIEPDEVAGLALRDTITDTWEFDNVAWATINGGDALSAGNCEGNGADTTEATSHFHRIGSLSGRFTNVPAEGDMLMLFRETTFSIQTSVLDTTTLGLFRQPFGGTATEFATGIDTTAQFQYRVAGSYVDTVAATSLDLIEVVRIVADARKRAETGATEDFTFGWSTNIALRNVR